MWAHAAHTGSSFLVKRKEPKIHKEPVGSLTSNRRGQCPLSTPPEELETFVTGGSVTALRLLRGRSPQGISKGKPLRYAFGYFSRKRKVSAGVGCASPQGNFRFVQAAVWGRRQYTLCFKPKFQKGFSFCGLMPPTLAVPFL